MGRTHIHRPLPHSRSDAVGQITGQRLTVLHRLQQSLVGFLGQVFAHFLLIEYVHAVIL